uniref:organic cation/carnitine transporter 2-like n=1 Tax=Semicossyphus pulcher TaxID=241346 RepID=UPI0037E809A3
MKDYTHSIAFLGQWGRFQQVIFFLLCISIVPNGFGAFTLVFLMDVPDHHCLVPEGNLTEEWREAIIPMKMVNGKQERISCSRYKLDVVRNLSAQGFFPGRDVNLTELEQERCVDGWSYSKDIYQSTIVSEFDLVCSEQWKQPIISAIFYLGVFSGSFFAGQLSDRFGRKPVLFATMTVQTAFTFAQIFSVSWLTFTILLFFNGLGQMSNFVGALVLGAETLTGNVRVLYSSLGTCLGFAIGYMMLPLFAYFLRDWKSLLVALSVSSLVYLPFWWFIPESPRWLLTQGRVEEAEAIVRKAAKWNKVQAPRVIFQDCDVDETETQPKEHHSVLDLVRNSQLRFMTFILCLVLFTMIFGYYSLSLNTAHLHVDPFISCFLSAAMEVPASVSSWLALVYLPRRVAVISTLLFEAVPLYLIQLVPQSLPNLALSLEMFAKYSIATGSYLMFAYISELYPTVLRNTGTGICTMISRLGSCFAPLLLHLSIYFKYLPYIILATMAAVSAFAALFLPESFGKPLPETIQQMPKIERPKCPCITEKAPRLLDD